MAHIKIQSEDFDVGAEFARDYRRAGPISAASAALFGTVRADTRAPQPGAASAVTGMTLEHYPWDDRARHRPDRRPGGAERWPLLGCTVIHRVGPLRPGENIVLVIAASAHRQAALDATGVPDRLAEDQGTVLEARGFSNGDGAWVDAREDDDVAASRWS